LNGVLREFGSIFSHDFHDVKTLDQIAIMTHTKTVGQDRHFLSKTSYLLQQTLNKNRSKIPKKLESDQKAHQFQDSKKTIGKIIYQKNQKAWRHINFVNMTKIKIYSHDNRL
jgi:hypothetical protein